MDAWAGPFYAAALLLAAAGALKAFDPTNTVGALRALGVGVPRPVVRGGGAIELIIGMWAVVTGAVVAALLVAASYLLFSVFVLVALRRQVPIGSCGCFGKVDTPPSRVHLVVNGGAVAVALAVAVGGPVPLVDVLADQPAAGVPFVIFTLTAVGGAFLALTALPRLLLLLLPRAASSVGGLDHSRAASSVGGLDHSRAASSVGGLDHSRAASSVGGLDR